MTKLSIMILRLNRTFKKDTQSTIIENITHLLKNKCDLKIIRPTYYQFNTKENHSEQNFFSLYDFKNAFDLIEETKPDVILVMSAYEIIGLSFIMAAKINRIPVVRIFDYSPNFYDELNTAELVKVRTITAFSKTALEDVTGKQSNYLANFSFLIRKFSFMFKTMSKANHSILQILKFFLFYIYSLTSKNDMKIQKLFQADLNLCSTQIWIDNLLKNNFKKSTLRLTGSCTFDEYFSKINNSHLKKSNSLKHILFCPSSMFGHGLWSQDKEKTIILDTINTIQKSNFYELSIKLHPVSHDLKEFQTFSKNFNKKISIYQKEDIVKLFSTTDLVITYGVSSVGLFASLFKLPVIYIIPSTSDLKLSLFFDEKISLKCDDPKEINSIIKKFENKPTDIDYDKYFAKFIGKFDGKSTERMATAILELIK